MATKRRVEKGKKRCKISVCRTITKISKPVSHLFLFSFILMLAFAGLIFQPGNVCAGSATLAWTAPTTNTDGTPLTDLAGYKIYYGTTPGTYAQNTDVGNVLTYAVPNLAGGTYYFAVTSYDSAGNQSCYSAQVSKTIQAPYTLTITDSGTGSGTVTSSPSGISCGTVCSASYNSGSVVTLTAAPTSGSTFTGWSGGGCSGTGTCSFTISANTSVTATFAAQTQQTFSITASSGANGSITPSGTTTVNSGSGQTYTITPATGYSISGVTVDGTSVGAVATYTFSNVTANHTIAATFTAQTQTYTITSSAGTGGSISPSGTYTVNSGGSQTCTITASTGYAVASVLVDGAAVGAVSSYTFSNVTANHTISATFASNGGTGTTTINLYPASDTFLNLDSNNYSTSTDLYAYTWPAAKVANTMLMKFDLSSIPAGATVQSASLTLYLEDSDKNTSYPTYNLSLNRIINHNPDLSKATGNTYDGTNSWTANSLAYNNIPLAQADLSAAYDTQAVNQTLGLKAWNATQLIKDWIATPSSNYGLLVNSDPAAPSDTYRTFGSSKNATASYHPYLTVTYSTGSVSSYTITSTAGTGGSITPSGTTKINSGGSQTYTITPSTGYSIVSVLVDGASVGAVSSYSFSGVTANHTISATFTAKTYTITATAGTGGSISPSGTTTVSSGGSQTYTITASTGYAIGSVSVDGTSVGAVSSYSFSGVTTNHTIAAIFTAKTYTITATAGTGGSISPLGTTTLNSGGSQNFTITASTGYTIGSVTVDGASVGAVSSYSFSSVTANHTIAATFTAKPQTYTITATAGTGGSIAPSGTTTVNSGGSQTYTITASSGYSISGVTVDGTSVGAVATYTFSNVTANHTIAATFAATTAAVFATNSGGSQYTSQSGIVFQADKDYSGGSGSSTTAAITGTTDSTLYKSDRYGNFSYSIPLANGSYNVTLKFAEIYFSAAGQRVFNVSMQGTQVISNLDIYAKVGKNAAYDVTIPVTVTNGTLNISFSSTVNYAKVSAIVVTH